LRTASRSAVMAVSAFQIAAHNRKKIIQNKVLFFAFPL
jgi:hypothetical protein